MKNKRNRTITTIEAGATIQSAKIQQNKSENKTFHKQLDRFFSGEMASHEVINVCSTPNILKLLNSTAKKIVLSQRDLKNAVSSNKTGDKYHTQGHNIAKEELYKLPDEIRNPIMVLKGNNRNNNSVILITDIENRNGEKVFVPISLDRQNGKISNISTLYGKKNLSAFLKNHKQNILAINKEKAYLLADTENQYLQSINETVVRFDNTIAYSTENVKTYSNNENNISEKENVKMTRHESINEYTVSFIEKCMTGEAKIEQVDDYIETWHKSDIDIPLQQYLGMTDYEFVQFGIHDNSILNEVIYCRKNNIELSEHIKNRIEDLQSYFWEESNEPYTQEWREELSDWEQAIVDKWDSGYDRGINRLLQSIVNEEKNVYSEKLPDELTIEDMENYGYTYDQRNKILPLSAERARELYGDGYEIYRIYPDNTEGLVEDVSEILSHDNVGGLFGIEEKEALNALCRELADDIEQYAYERGEYDYTGDDRLSWIADYRANTEYNIYYLLSHKDEKIIDYLFDERATLDESDELYERATVLLSKTQALISDNTLKQDFIQALESSEQLYQNIECGNILTREKMIEEAAELYDLGDDTNAVDYSEYYREYNPQSQIEVVIVEPNKAAYIGTVDNNLEAMQKLVGGYIEPVRLNEDTVLICNEEGKLRGLEPNRIVDNTEIVGTFFICKEKNGEYVSLSPNELQTIEATFKNPYGLTQTHISVDKPTFFIDMVGTLARFHDEAGYIERMFEKGFFENLKPFDNAVAAASGLALNDEFDVYILSPVINEQCRLEQNAWLDKYLPEIPHEQRIFLPMGADKSAIIDGINSKCILWDDYNKNLEEWQKAGGTSVKCHNNINHKGLVGELWKGKVVSINNTTSAQIEGELSSIAHAESQVEEIIETVTATATMTMSM